MNNKMFDSKDFLALFQEAGISAETITKDFTDALNAALAEKKRIDEEEAKRKAEEEAARKREELKAALEAAKAKTKMREADDLAARVNAFMKTHYAEFSNSDITGQQIVELCDEMSNLVKGFKDLEKMFNNIQKEEKKDCGFAVPKDPISDFLRANGLL